MKSKPKRVWTKKEVEALAAKIHEVGRRAATKVNPHQFQNKWPDINPAVRVGFRAIVRWLIKHL